MAKVAGVEALAAAFPYNAAKPSEFGAAVREPAKGQQGPGSGAGRTEHRWKHIVGDKCFAEGRKRQSAGELRGFLEHVVEPRRVPPSMRRTMGTRPSTEDEAVHSTERRAAHDQLQRA